MLDVTHTTTALLNGLNADDGDAAWELLDRRYRPIITGLARRLGLSDQDAQDVSQETMLRVLSEYRSGKYDRDRGRMRSWILAIARTKIADMHRKRGVRKEYRGESALVTMPTEAELDDLWSNERRQVILREALIELQSTSKMADRTIRAFEMLVFHHRPVTDIAAELNMTENDIYLAKSRVAAKLRDTVQTLEAAFDEDGL
ncbi:MAG: RNA polymerase sigma factor [Planctomycetes bacterium]|jgi:RNA polymerase sigma-70 factor (ECF subfamily)|nr:RNA polymerase sigma factor [Planctomycetota bacterium]MCP4838621.1 RNA polymerase sigma factor [Planctomycetota bacterium]